MTTFKYTAVAKDGSNVKSTIQARDENEAMERIRKTAVLVTSIEAVRTTRSGESIWERDLFGPSKVKEKTLALVCSQFSIILGSGLPVVRCVELIAGQTADKGLKKILEDVGESVAAGSGLAASFERYASQLPATFIETVRTGEESGTLETVFARLQHYFDKNAKSKAKVASALAYPAFTLAVAVVVIGIIMVVAVPVFSDMFGGMGNLPGPTRMIIAISNFFTNNLIWIIIAVLVFLIVHRLYAGTEMGRLAIARRRLNTPLLGKIRRMRSASEFASTLATVLSAGLPMLRGIQITARGLENAWLGKNLEEVAGGIEEGRRLGDCLRRTGEFPTLLTEMTAVGEEAGSLESTLDVVGEYYDNETQTASDRALALLQPIIILVLAIIIVFILLAVYLPLFNMYDTF